MLKILQSACFAALLSLSVPVFAQADPAAAAARKKASEDFQTPGPMHKVLAILEGEWNGDATFWPYPGAAPIKSTSHAVNKPLYNGLFQEQDHTGSIMGKPYLTKLIWGYDNARKTFVISGIDNMGSGFLRTEGTYDSTTRTFTFIGAKTNPVTGKDDVLKETRTLSADNNTQTMDLYVPDGTSGGYRHVLNMIYTRQK